MEVTLGLRATIMVIAALLLAFGTATAESLHVATAVADSLPEAPPMMGLLLVATATRVATAAAATVLGVAVAG